MKIGSITQLTENKGGAAGLDMRDRALEGVGKIMFINDIEKANSYLIAATFQCIFRTNGYCWSKCGCRPYCEPDKNGLETVNHLGEVEEVGGEDEKITAHI